MGFFSSLLGEEGSDAARQAAADTYQKQQGAVTKLLGYGDDYKNNLYSLFAPYAATGANANAAYNRVLNDPTQVRGLPGYQFTQDEGQRAIERSAAARGMDQSGRTLKDLTRFSQGTADGYLQNWLNQLKSGTAVGLQGAAGMAQGDQGQLGARTTAYQGDYGSAPTIGQGEIAAANARAAGAQNILNFGGKILGGMMGNPFSFGGSGGGYSGPIGAVGYGGWKNPDFG